jgi:hypothetical protein
VGFWILLDIKGINRRWSHLNVFVWVIWRIHRKSRAIATLKSIAGPATFSDVVRSQVQYFESLHLEGEWNPSTGWKNVEEWARIEEHGRANWRNIADCIATFCDQPAKAIVSSEVIRFACRERLKAIGQFGVGSNQDLSLIVENAIRNLHKVLCSGPPRKIASIHDDSPMSTSQ